MADGRRYNKGTKGNKGGRPPKADEISMIEKMDATLAPIEVWKRLSNKVKEEDTQAIKTWLSYRYGMPKQITELSVNTENTIFKSLDIDVKEDDSTK